MAWSKWVFGGLGWAMGGPIGAIIGFGLGTVLDSSASSGGGTSVSQPGDFGASLLVLCAAVMKSDNRILKSELDFVKAFFVQQFGTTKAQELTLMLREVLKQDIPVEAVSRQISVHLDQSSKLQLMHLLFGISASDGEVHPEEIKMLNSISGWMGISFADFESIKSMFVKDTSSAYKVLEVENTATNDEIKKAYRAMAIKHHPDKVQHLGETFQKAAQEKFQAINAAYEQIKKERGII